jgi:hypothetical protein
MGVLALVSAVVMPQWVLLEQTHGYFVAWSRHFQS